MLLMPSSNPMSALTILGPKTFLTMPWRNGLGSTIELLKQDLPGSDGFAWRLSMAEVTTDGEFSNFSGYDRTLLLLEGKGLTLDCSGSDGSAKHLAKHHLEKPLQAARFKGEDPTFASLHDGPIKDFNIMTQRQACEARVVSAVHPAESTISVDADLLLIYAVDDELKLNGAGLTDLNLSVGHLCVLRDPAKAPLHCRGASHILVQITYHQTFA